jgi:hypothetical protein
VDRDGQAYVAGVSSTNFSVFRQKTQDFVFLINCHTLVDAFTDFLVGTIEGFSRKLGDSCQEHTECLTGHCKKDRCEPGPPPDASGCASATSVGPAHPCWLVVCLAVVRRRMRTC